MPTTRGGDSAMWGVIPCSKEKIWDKLPQKGGVRADRAYRSAFHIAAKNYAEKFCTGYLILSAKYGLMKPSFIIPHSYDVTFSRPDDPYIRLSELREQASHHKHIKKIQVLCPSVYATKLTQAFSSCDVRLEFPLRGLGSFGAMHTWLRNAICD